LVTECAVQRKYNHILTLLANVSHLELRHRNISVRKEASFPLEFSNVESKKENPMPNAALAVAPVAMPAWFLAAQKEIGVRQPPENRGPDIRRYVGLAHCGAGGRLVVRHLRQRHVGKRWYPRHSVGARPVI
jgi:hypothetical protein